MDAYFTCCHTPLASTPCTKGCDGINGVRHCGILHHKNAAYLFRLLEGDDTLLDIKEKVKKSKSASGLAKLVRECIFPFKPRRHIRLGAVRSGARFGNYLYRSFLWSAHIFDELDASELKLFGLTIAMAKWLHGMGAKLLFASATLPQFAENLLREHLPIDNESIIAPNKNEERDAKVLNFGTPSHPYSTRHNP